MGARTRRFTSLATGSGKVTAVVACAVMLLAGCGGSGGSATEAGEPVIRGDVAGDSGSTVTAPGQPPVPTAVGGDGKITVTVSPGTTGGTPTAYVVKVYVKSDDPNASTMYTFAGNCPVTGEAGSCEVTGLTPGLHVAMTRATNTVGSSIWNQWSEGVELTGYRKVVFLDMSSGQTGSYAQRGSSPTALIPNTFVNSGSSFLGWNTDQQGRGVAYAAGASYSFESNITLYAQWGPTSATPSVAAMPSVATPAATVPGAPGLTSLSRRSKTEVWVTFSAPSSNGGADITGYTVTARRNGVDVTQSFPKEAGKVSVGPLTRNADYIFTVRAVNSVGTSGPSSEMSFRVV